MTNNPDDTSGPDTSHQCEAWHVGRVIFPIQLIITHRDEPGEIMHSVRPMDPLTLRHQHESSPHYMSLQPNTVQDAIHHPPERALEDDDKFSRILGRAHPPTRARSQRKKKWKRKRHPGHANQ